MRTHAATLGITSSAGLKLGRHFLSRDRILQNLIVVELVPWGCTDTRVLGLSPFSKSLDDERSTFFVVETCDFHCAALREDGEGPGHWRRKSSLPSFKFQVPSSNYSNIEHTFSCFAQALLHTFVCTSSLAHIGKLKLNTMTMKRSRVDPKDLANMANCLMLLSQGEINSKISPPSRVFVCKTCNRKFSSFQALGGHRASHKKPKQMAGDLSPHSRMISHSTSKAHECSICGLEFAIGQALGGHMRRHRAIISSKCSSVPPQHVPVFKRSNSKRVLSLDLNLAPLENDFEFKIENRLVFDNITPPP
ncbi:hypothetical protein IFM89_011112 [Coptis chinensis]|uniref:C2H2-type domain-containing protein n=1 Tax=Coptis chinensis TaxID=261450 RepID=A0A835H266_9MAGN|nr:hypothetical protein IFM89_011112 [Coptis chinensis]